MRILIIEDDKDTQQFLKTRLEEKCFAVDATDNGNEGVFLAKSNDYDLILVDYSLPGKNGFEICDEVRQFGKHTPIIMISVTNEVPHKVSSFHHGIDDYMTKPFFFDELYARIHALLRRPRLQASNILTIDDLVLDCNRQIVYRGDEKLYLTRKEFSLLEYLLRNSGQVVSRGSMIEHVWDMNIDPFSNTIETHILNLRKKVDGVNKKKLIHSVPGRGYKIDLEK